MFVDAVLAVYAGILSWAALSDALRLRIPNNVPLALLALYPLYIAISHGDPMQALAAAGLAAVVFLVGFFFFARGWMGGGDVKLMSVGALWAGPALLPDFLIVTALAGGVQALLSLVPLYKFLPHWATLAFAMPGSATSPAGATASADAPAAAKPPRRRNLPYGIAIAIGGLYVAGRLAGLVAI